MAESTIKLRKMTEDSALVVKVDLTPEFRARRWIGVRLVALAAWVMGCDIEIMSRDDYVSPQCRCWYGDDEDD